VILVSGGGKGIVSACTYALACDTGAALVILGRSLPDKDPDLALHLKKLRDIGTRTRYVPVDVSHDEAVKAAVAGAEKELGRITAIIHGAGHNEPKLVRDIDAADLKTAFLPKVQGLRNLLAAVEQDKLKLLMTFGSVIGRVGMRGEAHYALANACQTILTEEFALEHPVCRCLALESSAWSGAGMAERLGVLESLHRAGVAPIPLEKGVSWFSRLLSRRETFRSSGRQTSASSRERSTAASAISGAAAGVLSRR
jgi:enediyne polyketide synthase